MTNGLVHVVHLELKACSYLSSRGKLALKDSELSGLTISFKLIIYTQNERKGNEKEKQKKVNQRPCLPTLFGWRRKRD